MRPLHTRFRLTPSGPLHVGHALLAWLNWEAARSTGGTFLVRAEALKCLCAQDRQVNFRRWWRVNFDELDALGLTPTRAEVLNATEGLSASMAWSLQDDHALHQTLWRDLGLEAQYGAWPTPDCTPEGTEENPYSLHNWHSLKFGNYELEALHPYHVFAMAATEVLTRRTCLIRGDDHLPEMGLFNAFAQLVARRYYNLPDWDRIAQYVPQQHFIPKIMRSGALLPEDQRQPGGVVLASSSATTEGFYVRDVIAAGIEPRDLFRFLSGVLFGSDEAAQCAWTQWGEVSGFVDPEQRQGVHAGVQMIAAKVVKAPVIDDAAWFAFLGGQRPWSQ